VDIIENIQNNIVVIYEIKIFLCNLDIREFFFPNNIPFYSKKIEKKR
jgi:hypothetical protein